MTKNKKIGILGTANLVLSVLYIISMFVLGGSDSAFFSRTHAAIARQCYGLGLLILGFLMINLVVGKENLKEKIRDVTYFSAKETLLDDALENKKLEKEQLEINWGLGINVINILYALWLTFGELLGFKYGILQAFGFVYAMVWLILGMVYLPMLKEGGE